MKTGILPRIIHQNPVWLSGILFLALLSPYLVYLLANPYVFPGPDEAVQSQGAIELLRTGQYSGTPFLENNDLSDPKLGIQSIWPMGFPLLLFGILKLGIPLGIASKLLFLLTAGLGFYCWSIVGERFLNTSFQKWIFRILLPVQCLAWGTYLTSLLSWALVPAVILLLLEAREQFKNKNVFAVGALLALLMLIRYQNVVILIAVLVFLSKNRLGRLASFKNLIRVGVLPLAAGIFLLLRNQGHQNPVSHLPLVCNWNFRYVLDFISTLIWSGTFRLDQADLLFGGFIGSSVFAHALGPFVSVVGLVGLLLPWITGRIRDGIPKDIVKMTLFCILGLGVLFIGLRVFLNSGLITTGRYYSLIAPAILMIWCLNIGEFKNRSVRFSVYGILFSVSFCVLHLFSDHRLKLNSSYSEKKNSVLSVFRNMASQHPDLHSLVISDSLFGAFIEEPRTTVMNDLQWVQKKDYHYSKSGIVLIVQDRSGLPSDLPPLQGAEELIKRLQMDKIEVPGVAFHWKRVEPNTILNRITPANRR